MKKKKNILLFLFLVVIIQTIGLIVDFPYEGIIVWLFSVIFTLVAAYFTKDLATKK